MLLILTIGGYLFMMFEPSKRHSLIEAMYYVFSLIFGEPPETFPEDSRTLQALFFIVPILGLTVIIEGIIDFAMMLRDRKRSERSWCMTMAKSFSDHIVLVGFGRLGFRTFTLLRKLGEAVVVIEGDPHNQFLEEVRRDGSPLFVCDARREAILDDANVIKARAIIVATNDDLANLEIALDARRINPNIRVVLRMFDQHMADKIGHGFNIRIAMSQAAISAPTFAMTAVEPSIVNTVVVNDQLVIMQRWAVHKHGPLHELTVIDLLQEFGFTVVERHPKVGAPQIFPPADTRLHEGDRLIVQGTYAALTELRNATDHLAETNMPAK